MRESGHLSDVPVIEGGERLCVAVETRKPFGIDLSCDAYGEPSGRRIISIRASSIATPTLPENPARHLDSGGV